ncbi:MAG: ABC transporter substrate-binding protein [Phycisphaerae bacterium]
MSIRTWLLLFTLVGPAALLLAFGPRGRIDTPPGRVVIRYWEKWTGVEGQAIQRLVRRFNDSVGAERGIWVEYCTISNIDQRLLICTAGGDPPDVAGLFDSRIPQFADQGALHPLDELAREYHLDLDAIKPIWLQLGRYQGRLYALPSTPFTIALYYNRSLYREAGLDPDHPPQTTEELNEYARKLTRFEEKDGRRRIVQLGFTVSPAMLGWWHWVWPNFFDGRLWDGERFTYDTDAGRAAANWIRAFRDSIGNKDVLDFEAGAGPIESAENPFLAGRLAMVFQGPWMSTWIRTYAPKLDYGVAPFPSVTTKRRNVFASCDQFVIPAGAPHVREAMIFLEFMMRREVLDELCRLHGKVSPFREPTPEFFERHLNPYIRVFDEMASSPDAFGFPSMPTWSVAERATHDALQVILRGTRPPEEALRAAQTRVDAAVADYQRMARMRHGGAR